MGDTYMTSDGKTFSGSLFSEADAKNHQDLLDRINSSSSSSSSQKKITESTIVEDDDKKNDKVEEGNSKG